jgi:hypothetical protein
MRSRRFLVFGLIAPLLFTLGYSAYSSLRLHQAAARTSRILAEIRTWRLHETDGNIVERFTRSYSSYRHVAGDCSTNCTIELNNYQSPAEWIASSKYLYPVAYTLGDRFVKFYFAFEVQSGVLTEVEFLYDVGLRNGELRIFHITSQAWGPPAGIIGNYYATRPHVTSPPLGGDALMLHYQDPTPAEWERIMRFNFDCISVWRNCSTFDQFVPFAWQTWLNNRPVTK